jgi:wyosine [tRNA(Phe)-imidazoG37] synthetase (radical SAM superfamily)
VTQASGFLYGPVPSRRLGRSLGIDLVPFKTCSYDCVYCQLGRTTRKTVERREWVSLDPIYAALEDVLADPEGIDVITLSGSGEPTLHDRIGELIAWLKGRTALPVAVLTNGSLLWRPDVRDDLAEADLVIPSLDAGDPASYRYSNRPHPAVPFELMVEGLAAFTRSFSGRVWLEVMLLEGVTGIDEEVAAIARLARRIGPERVQLGTVTRPPADELATAVDFDDLDRLRGLFEPPAELIAERPDDVLAVRSDEPGGREILGLLERRPCTVHDIARGLGIAEPHVVKLVARLVVQGAVDTRYLDGKVYYGPGSRRGAEA